MISKEAVKRGYNRGNYTVGAPTQPRFAQGLGTVSGEPVFSANPVPVPTEIIERLEALADRVVVDPTLVRDGTRDWWAGTMIAETGGRPATPDAVIVHVSSTEQVQGIMRVAYAANIPVTVSAGRSNVTGSALPVSGGIVLDVCGLDKFTAYDEESQLLEVEAGVFGDIFEERIQAEHGMTLGHWPSSYAISTVGGWVACRGAGQLSTRYGKIEDMVHGLDVVLANGDLVSLGNGTRAAVGPDLLQLFIGSEGTLGVITKIRFKLNRLPEHGRAIAYGFDTFAEGLEACRQIMQQGATPAALRLYDELESGLQFGLPDKNVLLVADEGEKEIVEAGLTLSEGVCAASAVKLDGDAIFERWLDTRYLTGKSAEGFKPSPGLVADTLEMIGNWRDLPVIYDEVVAAINAVPGTLAGSAHQSHAYLDGACLYFSLRGEVPVDERARWYRAAWDAANEVILRHGATLSHHHGVGLLRAPYMAESLGAGFDVLRAIKTALDPKKLLNPGKLGL